MDFPLTVGKDFPEEILDVQSILLGGGITFSFTLDPDFPYQEARIEQATLTLPSWVREEFPFYTNGRQMDWPFPNIIHPGEVNSFTLWYPYNDYVPKEGEGIQEPGHRMVLDATVSIDGILSVDKKKRKIHRRRPTPGRPHSITLLVPNSPAFQKYWPSGPVQKFGGPNAVLL
jgi:hypothetical protein